jgi:hypothetical protein
MRPAPPPRVTLATRFEGGRRIRDLRLRSGDERRQAVDAGIGDYRLWLRLWLWLILRLLTRFARFTVLARLTMLTWFAVLTWFALLTRFAGRLLVALIGRVVAVATLMIAGTTVAVANKRLGLRLRLRRNEAGLLAEIREALAVIIEIIGRRHVLDIARRRLVLTELLLGSSDQAKIMLGMLIVVLGCNGIAGGAGITRELDVFFGNM